MTASEAITGIRAREILSGSGRPTVEVDVEVAGRTLGTASVPSGTSTGQYEAFELLDGGSRYGGRGVRSAVENVNRIIAPALLGVSVLDQKAIDSAMLELDGTPQKEMLGGNAILGVSVAAAKAASRMLGVPSYRYIGGLAATGLPVPIATVIAGGAHAPNSLDFEDYILIFDRFDTFADALEALVATRRALGALLEKKLGHVPDIGGALAPDLASSGDAFDVMLEAVHLAGYDGRVSLGVDVAASSLYDRTNGTYSIDGTDADPQALTERYTALADKYPLAFIEDPYTEDDYENHAELTRRLPTAYVVGDDLFATQASRLRAGAEVHAANTLLFKVNQVGTLSEALATVREARMHAYDLVVSLRSSDTADDVIADLAVAIGAAMIKLGSPVRGERVVKYNRLLAIEEELGSAGALMTLRRAG